MREVYNMPSEYTKSLIRQGRFSQSTYDALVEEAKKENVTKKDLDNLGVSQVNIMKQLKALDERIKVLEGGGA